MQVNQTGQLLAAPAVGYVVFIIIASLFQELKVQSSIVISIPVVFSTYPQITSLHGLHILELIPFSHKFFVLVCLRCSSCVFVIPCYFQPHALQVLFTCFFYIFPSVFLIKICPLCQHSFLLLGGLHSLLCHSYFCQLRL